MRTIQAIAQVTPEGTLTVPVPPDIAPGSHNVVIVIEDQPATPKKKRSPSELPVHHVGSWPEGFTVRREDIYDDWGR